MPECWKVCQELFKCICALQKLGLHAWVLCDVSGTFLLYWCIIQVCKALQLCQELSKSILKLQNVRIYPWVSKGMSWTFYYIGALWKLEIHAKVFTGVSRTIWTQHNLKIYAWVLKGLSGTFLMYLYNTKIRDIHLSVERCVRNVFNVFVQ